MKYYKLKTFIAKLLTFYLPKNLRKKYRRNMLNFSIYDYFHFRNMNYHVVSLGYNCLPRVAATAGRLKPRKIYGEKSCPFDTSLHNNFEKICELIENDFSNYFTGLEFDDKQNIWCNRIIDAAYIHDNIEQEAFINRYKARIKNFIELYNSSKKIYYIYSTYQTVSPP